MRYTDFLNRASNYPVFSLRDILKISPEFNRAQLDRWEKQGYLNKIKRGFYCFSNHDNNRDFLFYTANKIYSPSYISLETALKFYGLIPEEIFQITSVSTKKTTRFETQIGSFSYKQLKPALFWGYRLVDFGKQRLLIADPEKAMLDYLYLHPNIKTAEDFLEMRINSDELKAQINPLKFQKYLAAFKSRALTKRAKTLLNTLNQTS